MSYRNTFLLEEWQRSNDTIDKKYRNDMNRRLSGDFKSRGERLTRELEETRAILGYWKETEALTLHFTSTRYDTQELKEIRAFRKYWEEREAYVFALLEAQLFQEQRQNHVTEKEEYESKSNIEVAEDTHVHEEHTYSDFEMEASLDEPVSSHVANNELSVQIKELENCKSNNLSRPQAKVQDEECKVIIDGGSCHRNLASKEMSETLGLKLFQNPHPCHQMCDKLAAQHNGKTNHYYAKWKEKDSVEHNEVSPIFNDSDLSPYLGDEEKSESRTTLFEEGEDDEDITHENDQQTEEMFKGPITRSRAKKLHDQVKSLLTGTSLNANSILPNSNTFLILRNIKMDEEMYKAAGPNKAKVTSQIHMPNVTRNNDVGGDIYVTNSSKENVTHEGKPNEGNVHKEFNGVTEWEAD